MLTALKNLFFLAIGGILLWLTFRNQDFSTVWVKVKSADPLYIILSCCCSVAALISRSMRWLQLIRPLGYRPRLSSAYHALLFGYLANMAIPRLGEISRCGALRKSDEVPFEKLIGTVIVERLLDVMMLAICIALTAFMEFDRLGGFFMEHLIFPAKEKIGGSTALIIIVLIISIVMIAGVYRLFRMSNPPQFVQKIKDLLVGVMQGLRAFAQVERKGLFAFHTIFIWLMYFLMSYLCFFALPDTQYLDAAAALFIMVLGGLGMTAPVQGGIGTYHLLVSSGLLLYGLTETDGLAYATLSHTIATGLLIILGFISMLFLFFLIKTRNSAIEYESSAND